MKNKSFIVTGASASGKSTLINLAVNEEYIYLPTHMTRKPRLGEENNRDAIFLTNEEFEENFKNGIYLEESLDFALLKKLGVYYGTPKSWISFLAMNGYCAIPVSITIATKIKEKIDVMWVHLYCNDTDRYDRLVARGISLEEVEKRMISGDSINFPQNANEIINTSYNKPTEILRKIRRL